jgi:hypothetical protein
MGSKTVMYSINTQKSMEEVKQATLRSLMVLGGTVTDMGDNIQIKEGKNNVNFGFTANFDAWVNIRQVTPERYDFFATINWKPNAVFWVCLGVGAFVLGILWVLCLLYFFIDPSSAYQQALFQVQTLLN